MNKISAKAVTDDSKLQYHISCRPGDISERVLMVGDPARVEVVAKRFQKTFFRAQHREYVMVTGEHQGLDLTVFATGMGQDTTEIAVIEICQITTNPTFIRCGSSGALQPEINMGDLVVTQASLRMDGTTPYYVSHGYPAVAHNDVVLALSTASFGRKVPFHVGLTASMPGFYGPQGREMEGFPILRPDLPEELAKQGVLNFEMETSTLLTLSSLRGVRAGAVCAIFANRTRDEFLDEVGRMKAEHHCIDVSLDAFHLLHKMDEEKKNHKSPIWIPVDKI